MVVVGVVGEEGGGDMLAVKGEGGMEGRVGYVMSDERVDSAVVVVEDEVVEGRGFWRRYSVSHLLAAMMAGCVDSDVDRIVGCG